MRLYENLEKVKERIANVQLRTGNKKPVEIVAITKTHPYEILSEVAKSGLRSIGENRIQEAEDKFSQATDTLPKLTKRLVGHLQSNKINKALQLFDVIDSVDSFELAQKIGKRSSSMPFPVLLEINTSGESAKFGFIPEVTHEILSCFEIEGIDIQGLMTVGPLTRDSKKIRKAFIDLRTMLENINSQISKAEKPKELSMGMSGDFEIAIEEGASMVRLGTVLFGPRGTYQ